MASVFVTFISVLGFLKDGNSFPYWRFVIIWRGIKIIPAALCDCSTSTVISRVCAISGLPLAVGWWEVGVWSSAAWSLLQAHVYYCVYSWADWFLPYISVAHPTILVCLAPRVLQGSVLCVCLQVDTSRLSGDSDLARHREQCGKQMHITLSARAGSMSLASSSHIYCL